MSAGMIDVLYSGVMTGTKAQVSDVEQDIAGYHILNETAALSYLQIYYKLAAAVTVGTTVADLVIPLPASGGATMKFEGKGWRTRGTGLTIAHTTTSTGAVSAAGYATIWRSR